MFCSGGNTMYNAKKKWKSIIVFESKLQTLLFRCKTSDQRRDYRFLTWKWSAEWIVFTFKLQTSFV